MRPRHFAAPSVVNRPHAVLRPETPIEDRRDVLFKTMRSFDHGGGIDVGPRRYNTNMEKEAAEILERAVRLPEEARAALADCLLDSLDTDVDEDSEEAWVEEIHRRLQEIDSKAVDLIPWPDARRRLEARLKR
jgi:hypothetical protein